MGVFASAFYIGYIIAQIPSGLILDRYAFRWPMALVIIICSISFIAFIYESNFHVGVALRVLVGLMSGMSFIGVLYIARMYLDNKWLPFVSGITVAIGTLSASFIQTVSAFFMGSYSWHTTMIFFSLWGLLIAFLLLVIPLNQREHHIQFPEKSIKDIMHAIVQMLSMPRFLLNALIAGLFYLPTSVITAVWGVVFFKTTYHLSSEDASAIIFMIFLGWAVGAPLVGLMASKAARTRKMTVIPAILGALTITAMLYHPTVVGHAVYFFGFMFGLFSSAQVLVWKTYDQICPAEHTGLGVALTNMIVLFVVALVHPLVAWLIDLGYAQSELLQSDVLLCGLGVLPVVFVLVALLGLISNRQN